MWNLKRNNTNELILQNRNRLPNLENKFLVGGGEDGEKGYLEFGTAMYIRLYLK